MHMQGLLNLAHILSRVHMRHSHSLIMPTRPSYLWMVGEYIVQTSYDPYFKTFPSAQKFPKTTVTSKSTKHYSRVYNMAGLQGKEGYIGLQPTPSLVGADLRSFLMYPT